MGESRLLLWLRPLLSPSRTTRGSHRPNSSRVSFRLNPPESFIPVTNCGSSWFQSPVLYMLLISLRTLRSSYLPCDHYWEDSLVFVFLCLLTFALFIFYYCLLPALTHDWCFGSSFTLTCLSFTHCLLKTANGSLDKFWVIITTAVFWHNPLHYNPLNTLLTFTVLS